LQWLSDSAAVFVQSFGENFKLLGLVEDQPGGASLDFSAVHLNNLNFLVDALCRPAL